MQLIGQTIRHQQFGKGVVTACDHNIITIDFPDGVRRFVYPDAFKDFLIPRDTDTKDEIQGLLVERKLEEKKRHLENLEHQKKLAHLRAMKIPPLGQLVFDTGDQEDPLETGSCSTGVYLSGFSKGENRIPQRVNFYTMCILTRCGEDGNEKDRKILGLAMTAEDFVGDECHDGAVPLHPNYRLRLPKPLPLWSYLGKQPQKSWGRTTFRYTSNKIGEAILRDARDQFAGTPDMDLAQEFYRHYCECNHLTAR